MIRIVSLDIVDLISFPSGILFVIKEGEDRETSKISFYSFDIKTGTIASVTKNAYLLTKFGAAFSAISSQLNDYISCDTAKLWNGQTMVLYSTGEFGLFDENGKLLKTDSVIYKDAPARDITVDNNYVWCTVPDKNLIVKYSVQQSRVVLRIGSESGSTFNGPVSITEADGKLYVCNPSSRKIKTVDLSDYSVKDYKEFDEAVYKFIKVEDHEFVILASGVYMI